jgi:hypothetical protein
MGSQIAIVLYVAAMAALIIGSDVAFFRDRFWERLMLNVGIVLVFAAFYLRFIGVHGRHVTIFARLPDLLGTVQREDSNTLIQKKPQQFSGAAPSDYSAQRRWCAHG